MNKFYSIKGISDCLEHPYQLKNLGKTRNGMSIGVYGRDSFSGRNIKWSDSSYIKITSKDYDNLFAETLTKISPPYHVDRFLNYHLNYFITKEQDEKKEFFKQIKYVIIPIIQKQKNNETYIDLINQWLDENGMNDITKNKNMTIIKTGDVNAPLQIQQNVNNSQQTQDISLSKNITELFSLLRKDITKFDKDIADEFNIEINYASELIKKDKNIISPLRNIGTLIKSVGINVFANLIASPIFETIRPFLGL